ncbi:MAG TPA: TetR/AcrR family transcriptional regulator [Alphaproteobacteria bacterium]|nr:TetR/AcrR family transcriptional regulator [Alphaproteobacteria bacterium]
MSNRKRRTLGRPARTNDPDKTKQDIIAVATHEFAAKGLSGARIDEIADRTRTSKRMIYYYFGSKEGLYLKVLEEAYRQIRNSESELKLEHLSPEEGLAQIVSATFDYHHTHPDFARLVMNENIHEGKYLAKSKMIQRLNVPAIAALHAIYERGVRAGVFRQGLDPVDLHMSISAMCFFNVSNRFTFSTIFKRDMSSPTVLDARRRITVETILRFVRR